MMALVLVVWLSGCSCCSCRCRCGIVVVVVDSGTCDVIMITASLLQESVYLMMALVL